MQKDGFCRPFFLTRKDENSVASIKKVIVFFLTISLDKLAEWFII